MKKILCTLYMAALCLTAGAGVVDQADEAYGNDDFAAAARLYEQAIDELGPSAERYYNAGNAHYRNGNLGLAIVNYERALRLDPGNKDIRDNLEFVNSKITDKTESTKSFVSSATEKIAGIMHPNSWAWVGMTLFLLALAGAGCYFFGSSVILRKVGFFGSGILLILCVGANILAYRSTRKAMADNEGIIVTPSVILSTTPRAPRDRSEEAMLLHEGTKLSIIDSISTGKEKWLDVRVDDTHRAWIPAETVVII